MQLNETHNEFKNNIPKEFVIGRNYHTDWAKSRGYVWRLVSFDEVKNTANLETPKTKKKLTTQLSSLRDTNKQISKIIKSTKQLNQSKEDEKN